MKISRSSIAIGLFFGGWASPTLAHHAMGGGAPTTVVEGLLSGIAHPVIGIDHFAFLIAMGIAAAFTSRPRIAPLAFVFATVAGCLLFVAGLRLPGVEIVVAGSVVAVGALVVSGRSCKATPLLTLFAAAGLAHGMAYGGAIVGAESTPLLAYLAGFAVVQTAIALTAGALVRRHADADGVAALQPRLAGAVAAGVGCAILVENLEGLLFVV
tara:strand:- start:994 stop:1629 length:636 start_codon:yes stop_codon:yes gene_type:complete